MEESQSNVAYGYLAVLLANLCLNTTVQERVRVMLPRRSLDVLVRSVDEFTLYHQKVEREVLNGANGGGTVEHLTDRLQAVVDRLRGVD